MIKQIPPPAFFDRNLSTDDIKNMAEVIDRLDIRTLLLQQSKKPIYQIPIANLPNENIQELLDTVSGDDLNEKLQELLNTITDHDSQREDSPSCRLSPDLSQQDMYTESAIKAWVLENDISHQQSIWKLKSIPFEKELKYLEKASEDEMISYMNKETAMTRYRALIYCSEFRPEIYRSLIKQYPNEAFIVQNDLPQRFIFSSDQHEMTLTEKNLAAIGFLYSWEYEGNMQGRSRLNGYLQVTHMRHPKLGDIFKIDVNPDKEPETVRNYLIKSHL